MNLKQREIMNDPQVIEIIKERRSRSFGHLKRIGRNRIPKMILVLL